MKDPFHADAGAYLIGALRGAEREAFESHLRGCADCRAEVEALEHLPALLALVPPQGAVDPPPSLLQGLLAAVRRREARRRAWLTGAGIAAAALFGVAASGELTPPWSEQEVASGLTVDFRAVAQTPVTATADLVAVPWGTRVDLTCTYPADEYAQPVEYTLIVHDDEGRSEQVASWTALPGADAKVPGATSVPLDRLTRIEMTAGGAVVLVAEL